MREKGSDNMTPDQSPQAEPNFQRVAVNLQQRLAEKVANYEGEIALMKDQYETQIEVLQNRLDAALAAAPAADETLSKKK